MKNNPLLITTIIMAVMSAVVFYFAYQKGVHMKGLIIAKGTLIQIVPLIVLALLLAGMVEVLLPSDLIARWIGGESGFKGIILGTLVGIFIPGGPYVVFPLLLGVYKMGAGIPIMVAIITSRALLGLNSILMEVGFLGLKLTLIRVGSTLIFAPLAGLIAMFIIRIFKIG